MSQSILSTTFCLVVNIMKVKFLYILVFYTCKVFHICWHINFKPIICQYGGTDV